jgi:hypothetical protein
LSHIPIALIVFVSRSDGFDRAVRGAEGWMQDVTRRGGKDKFILIIKFSAFQVNGLKI